MKFLQLPVDSITHAQGFFKRLNVNVGRSHLYREIKQHIRKFDNRPRRRAREIVSLAVKELAQPFVEVVHCVTPQKNSGAVKTSTAPHVKASSYFVCKNFSTVLVMTFMSGAAPV